MMCDIIIAADTAKFGQPKITIGTMRNGWHAAPAARRRQSQGDGLPPDGRMIDAAEAEQLGPGGAVVPAQAVRRSACGGDRIAGFSLPVVLKIKEAINRPTTVVPLGGLLFERREFHSTFALKTRRKVARVCRQA
jgi:enoyl-CoA hydratase